MHRLSKGLPTVLSISPTAEIIFFYEKAAYIQAPGVRAHLPMLEAAKLTQPERLWSLLDAGSEGRDPPDILWRIPFAVQMASPNLVRSGGWAKVRIQRQTNIIQTLKTSLHSKWG